ncbi:MAG: 2-C-methyl-D-erythritol 2,4-cyclodiphosphate synthase [Candidatus Omnitrophota bacterium]
MRVGIGYDIHKLEKGRKLILGGIEIPHAKGLVSYSDGDVLLHALCDALLGAAGMGDIGEHFPDTDPAFKGIKSVELLKRVKVLLDEKSCRIVNIDSVLMAEEPKLQNFKPKIKSYIAGILKLNENQINIKAATAEGFDAIGRKEAIAAFATVLVEEYSG